MTVKELIEKLLNEPMDADVCINTETRVVKVEGVEISHPFTFRKDGIALAVSHELVVKDEVAERRAIRWPVENQVT